MAEQKKPSRRGEQLRAHPPEGAVSKRLEFSLICQKLPRIDTGDPEELKGRIDWYFQECIKRDLRPGVEGLCNALHVNRSTLMRWGNGEVRVGSENKQIVMDARQLLADMWEQYMLNGEINPVTGIFLGSNQFGYDRNATVTVQTPSQLVSAEDPARLAEKYRADVIDVSAEDKRVQIPVKEPVFSEE